MTNVDRCINPAEITADDRLAYAEGQASAGAESHIESCAFCRREARAYATMGRTLSTALFRRSCPPSMTLGEYTLGLLEPVQMREVAAHLLDCPHCLAESHTFAAFMAQPDDPEPDQGLLGTLRRIFAQPLAPSPALSGLRGSNTGASATYVAEDQTVTIELQAPAPGRPGRIIAGLLQRNSSAPATAQLFEAGRAVESQHVDEFGSFFFAAVPSGSYRVEVTLADAIIVVEPVVVP